MKHKLLAMIILTLAIHTENSLAQATVESKMGKGVGILASDSSLYLKLNARIQNLYEGYYIKTNDASFTGPEYEDRFMVRRARLTLSGWMFASNLHYKLEYAFEKGEIYDAVIQWNISDNFSLWVGQTKLPGNRERVISSQKMQFVDRSLLNEKFNIDRDKGLQLRHHFNVGNIAFREYAAVSIGEGKNYTGFSGSSGYDYTGRFELLPFGEFAQNGDYSGGDLAREQSPKLAIGVTYDYNDNAMRERGQTGDVLSQRRDLSSVFADFMLKYKGFSVMGEYAAKRSSATSAISDSTGSVIESYYTGTGVNVQAGYLLKNNWEFALRLTQIIPDKMTGNTNISMYTLGISRYIVGHALKVQTDISYLTEDATPDEILFRAQLELGI